MTWASIHEWDGAYVLGALSPAERQEFEEHLEGCSRCRDAVSELAPLPGLLARVDLASLDSDPAPPSGLEERLLAAARPAPLWRRTSFRVGAAIATGLVAAALLVVVLVPRSDPAGERVALRAQVRVPLTASVVLHRADWGTRVDMTCVYEQSKYGAERGYTLYVVDAAGHAEQVSAWHAAPGDTSHTQGSTELSPAQIKRVELRGASGAVLLAAAT